MVERVEIHPYDYSDIFHKRTGLLVSISKKGKPNVMALDWKTIGELWHLPIITVAVAPSRYTYELLKEVPEFTLNIPSDKIEHAIMSAGSSSGRYTDKFKENNLEIIEGTKVKPPTIKDSWLSYECKIIHECKSGNMAEHTLFFGKIVAAFASNDII
ncbi:MAG: flavin reductase family protein [Promethearchaeia archaeon]